MPVRLGGIQNRFSGSALSSLEFCEVGFAEGSQVRMAWPYNSPRLVAYGLSSSLQLHADGRYLAFDRVRPAVEIIQRLQAKARCAHSFGSDPIKSNSTGSAKSLIEPFCQRTQFQRAYF